MDDLGDIITIEDVREIRDELKNKNEVNNSNGVDIDERDFESDIKESIKELIHPFVPFHDVKNNKIHRYEEKRADSVLLDLKRKRKEDTFTPIFFENKKMLSTKEDNEFLKSVVKAFSSLDANRQERIYGMTFMHAPAGNFVPLKDCDAFSLNISESALTRTRLVGSNTSSEYSGDRVRLCGAAYCDRPNKVFDLDGYFASTEVLKKGDDVVVFDASGKKHSQIVMGNKNHVITFNNGFSVDIKRLKAFVYPAKHEPLKTLSRRDVQDSCFVISMKEDEESVKAHVSSLCLTPREAYRRLKGTKDYTIEKTLQLIESDCQVVELLQKNELGKSKMGGGGGGIIPTKKKINKKKQVREATQIATTNNTNEMSAWDLHMTQAVNVSFLTKDQRKKEKLLLQTVDIRLIDGSTIAFNAGSMSVDASKSTIDASVYPGGIHDINSIYSLNAPPAGNFLYVKYPTAAKIGRNMKVLNLIDVIPIEVEKEEIVHDDIESERRFTKISATDHNAPPVVVDEEEELSKVSKGFVKYESIGVSQDPRSSYTKIETEVTTISGQKEGAEDEKMSRHFAKESIITFVALCCPEMDVQVIYRIRDVSDRIFAELGNDVDKLRIELADARIMNLKRLVQKFINTSGLPFPQTWGKDSRTAIRAIETIVQRDMTYELDIMNRKSQLIVCKDYMNYFAANYAIDLLSGIASLSNLKSFKCSRPHKKVRSILVYFDCVLNTIVHKRYDQNFVDTLKELEGVFEACIALRPSATDMIESLETREKEIESMHAFKGIVDIRPSKSSGEKTFDVDQLLKIPTRRVIREEDSMEDGPNKELYDVKDKGLVFVASDDLVTSDDLVNSDEIMTTLPEEQITTKQAVAWVNDNVDKFKIAKFIYDKVVLSDSTDVDTFIHFVRFDLPVVISRAIFFLEPSFTSGFVRSLPSSDKKNIMKIIQDRSESSDGEHPLRESMNNIISYVENIRRSSEMYRISIGNDEDGKNELFFLCYKVVKTITDIHSDIPNIFPDLDVKLVKAFERRIAMIEDFDVKTVSNRLDSQREANKNSKIKQFDRLSKENRQLVMMLRDTLGDAAEWESYLDTAPDDEYVDITKTYEDNSEIVIEEMDVVDQEKKEDLEEEADVLGYLGENPEDDEIDEDIY